MDTTRAARLPMDEQALASLDGRTVLITGGGGSIGSEICRQIAPVVERLIVISISESALYRVKKILKDAQCEVIGVLADYGDQMAMRAVMEGVDIVIHAGAQKQFPQFEENPIAAILNNVWATQKLLNTCQMHGVGHFIQISTDKAVEPTSIMGATKRVCELMELRRDWSPMRVSVVRFGNVLGSDGSVIPLWREQIAAGGPLTITSRQCTRYFMSIEQAAQLVIAVSHISDGGLFVFDMGDPVPIASIAEKMILNISQPIEIKEIGLRPGEKLEEELVHDGELVPTRHPKVFRIVDHRGTQPSHSYIPDMIEHARKHRTMEAVEFLWKIVNEAYKR